MQIGKATGPGAGVVKYDILTALLTMAAQDGGLHGRLALRLSLLITARYNWRSETFQTGQVEIARLWGVTDRTAKRELSQMRGLGWISVARPAAKGRVATHRIHMDRILADSRPRWESVGPDFTARLSGRPAETLPADNVVPMYPTPSFPVPEGAPWEGTAARLGASDPGLYQAWFARLRQRGVEAGVLQLIAPSAFVASYVTTHLRPVILAAALAEDPSLRGVEVVG